MQENSYYTMWRGNQKGPFSFEELLELYNNRTISNLHQVSHDRKEWVSLKDLISQFSAEDQNTAHPPIAEEKVYVQSAPPSIKESQPISTNSNENTHRNERVYTPFCQRTAASLIDLMIILTGLSVIVIILIALLYWAKYDAKSIQSIMRLYIPLLTAVGSWMYEVGFTVSNLSATPGKYWSDVIVVDKSGSTLSLALSNKRFFCKVLSGLLPVLGWLPIFGVKKQPLHDLMCETSVIQR